MPNPEAGQKATAVPPKEPSPAASQNATGELGTIQPRPLWRQPWFYLPITFATVAVLFLYPGDLLKSTPLVATAAHTADSPVELRAVLDHSVLHDETAVLRVTVSNPIPAPAKAADPNKALATGNKAPASLSNDLTSLHLDIAAPGFQLSNCVPANHECNLDVASLKSGETQEFAIPLTPRAGSGSYGVAVLASWKRNSGSSQAMTNPESASVTLSPIIIESRFGQASWARLGQRLAQVLKDLTLPFLLLWLSNRFTSQQAAREARDRAAESARLAAQQKADDALEISRQKAQVAEAEAQQVRQLLLERVMNFAEAYCLPIARSVKYLLDEAHKVQNKTDDADMDTTLLAALLLVDSFERLRKQKGGLFLQSRPAESLVGAAWRLVKETLVQVLTQKDVDAVLARPDDLASVSAFKGNIAAYTTARTNLERWIDKTPPSPTGRGSFDDYEGALDIIQAVLLFEVDRPLRKYWYGIDPESQPWIFYAQDALKMPPEENLSQGQQKAVNTIKAKLEEYCGHKVT